VYDHPPVTITRRDRVLTFDEFRSALCGDPVPAGCATG
jgi:hypothetical protein